jgi:hypothetical protein
MGVLMATSNENVAKNLEVIKKAIDQHDERCPGQIVAILMHPIEVDRLDFDTLYGIEIRADENQQTGTFWLLCDLEGQGDEDEEIEDAVSTQEVTPVTA